MIWLVIGFKILTARVRTIFQKLQQQHSASKSSTITPKTNQNYKKKVRKNNFSVHNVDKISWNVRTLADLSPKADKSIKRPSDKTPFLAAELHVNGIGIACFAGN